MYIRRKVFSSFIDENGEERYFSTTEFELQKNFADMLADMKIEEIKNKLAEGTPLTKAEREVLQGGAIHDQKVRNAIDEAVAKNNYVHGGAEERAIKAEEAAAKAQDPNYGKITGPTGKQKAAGWLKKTYGKGAQHRGRNIAITAAVPVVATGGVIAGKQIAKNRKAKKSED